MVLWSKDCTYFFRASLSGFAFCSNSGNSSLAELLSTLSSPTSYVTDAASSSPDEELDENMRSRRAMASSSPRGPLPPPIDFSSVNRLSTFLRKYPNMTLAAYTCAACTLLILMGALFIMAMGAPPPSTPVRWSRTISSASTEWMSVVRAERFTGSRSTIPSMGGASGTPASMNSLHTSRYMRSSTHFWFSTSFISFMRL
mmetsp:Transcript_64943/g.205159  ORF Transcript_64943/g.205159 Transcript_64943/m.205159 type:complete len:200 (-) Transcript_64943:530-1129(-)